MSIKIYHNPRCTKSRETLKLVESKGVVPLIIEYLKTPLSEAELKRLIALLGVEPRALLRTKEPDYKKAKLDQPGVTNADIVRAMAKYPKLIERPIVVKGDKAVIGRPPENVLSIL